MDAHIELLRVLPEVVLTLTGVLIMLGDALLTTDSSRKPLGWVAVLGVLSSIFASVAQLRLPPGMAYYGTIQTDAYSVFFHVIIAGIVLTSLLVTLDTPDAELNNGGELFALMVFGTVGMMLMTSAVELLLVFVGLEISSISSYIMAGFRKRSAKGTEASIKYFLLGSFATAFFLYGIALTFGATGTTAINGIAGVLRISATPVLALVGVGMILIGLGFKVSAAPFHVWTPDVYEGAPSPIVGLMSTAPKVAAFAVLLRLVYVAYPSLYTHWHPLLWWMAVLSMTIGNLGALRQRNVKRMLAYSAIAHAGYLLVAFTALSADGVSAAAFYALSYAAMNVGVFVIISHAGGYEDRLTLIDDYRGLAYRSPLLGGALGFFLISLIGIPFTGGFFGKFYVFSAAIRSGMVWLAILGLLNSGIATFYYLRLLIAAYTRPSETAPVLQVPRPTVPLLFALLITLSTTLTLGIAPEMALRTTRGAAMALWTTMWNATGTGHTAPPGAPPSRPAPSRH